MKLSLSLLLLFFTSSISAQIDELSRDYTKKKLSIIKRCSYFSNIIKENNITLTGYYHFDIGMVKEESNDNIRTYYYWDDELLCVFDQKMNKELFFEGDYRNASSKLYDYYNKKAAAYQAVFEPYFVKTIFSLSFIPGYIPYYDKHNYTAHISKAIFREQICIIKEDNRFEVTDMLIEYYGAVDSQYKTSGCKIPEDVKKYASHRSGHFFFEINLKDKENNKIISLPTISIK